MTNSQHVPADFEAWWKSEYSPGAPCPLSAAQAFEAGKRAGREAERGEAAPSPGTTAIEALKAAIEGECDGLAIDDAQATVILNYVAQAERAEADGWKDDPASDERWNAGADYALERLCAVLGVDPKKVNWDAATETLEGDVDAQIHNILSERAEAVTDAEPFAWWAETGTAGAGDECNKLFFMRELAVDHVCRHGGHVVTVYRGPPKPQPCRRARKIGGSYQAEGAIVAEFLADDGSPRYVFRFDEPAGLLHIFGAAQLEIDEVPQAPEPEPAPDVAATTARMDALLDSQYLAGATAGWNAAQADDPNAAFHRIVSSRDGYLAGFKAKPEPSPEVRRVRHKKRGTTYEVVGRAQVQVSDGDGLTDYELAVVYRSLNDGSLWVRRVSEFEDGRFEDLATLKPEGT